MSNKLKPEDLGNVGELTFMTLCGQAGLFCNKSSRDVTGWDFIVEFPMSDPGPTVVLDRRLTNACHIQLKSTAGEIDGRISLKLSAVELLAKHPRPSAIVVLMLRANGDPLSGYLVHLIDNNLARVLKRLRLAHSRKAFDLNHAKISFDYRSTGTRFDLTPQGLRGALALMCGDDPVGYIQRKQQQLSDLGYDKKGLEAEMLVWIEGPEHMNDVLLGLKPIKPKKVRFFDSRFGIRLPYKGSLVDELTELTLTPPQVGSCTISFHGVGLQPAAIFEGDMYIGPPIQEIGGPQLLIRHGDFILRLTGNMLEFETVGMFESKTRSLDQWVDFIRALSYMGTGQGRLTISFSHTIGAPSFPVDQRLDGPYAEELPQFSLFLDGWQHLIGIAGLRSVEEFAFGRILESLDARQAVDLILNPETTSYFEFQAAEGMELMDSVDALYCNSCSFVDAAISYSCRVGLKRTDDPVWKFRSASITLLHVCRAVDDLAEYGEEQAEKHGLKVLKVGSGASPETED